MASTELTVRLPPDLAEQLQVLATASNHSVDDIVLAQLRAALALGRPAEQVRVWDAACFLCVSHDLTALIVGQWAMSEIQRLEASSATTLTCRRH